MPFKAFAKKFVLTTEDGVDKYVGDQVWYVKKNFDLSFWKSGLPDRKNFTLSPGQKIFDKEENAQAYIDANKPSEFSNEQIIQFLIDSVKQLPKNKLFDIGTFKAIHYGEFFKKIKVNESLANKFWKAME